MKRIRLLRDVNKEGEYSRHYGIQRVDWSVDLPCTYRALCISIGSFDLIIAYRKKPAEKIGWRKRMGLWLCRRGRHKMKRFVSMDWASRGSMIQEVDTCQRCDLIVLVDVRGLTTEKKKWLRNAVYGLQEYEKIRVKKVK